jgi:DNA-binding LacI/PurR family transcriptional regulator
MDDTLANKPRVTSQDVARAAGVSQQTVSLVMRDHPRISARTKARVLAASATLGYRPNAAAASLRSSRSQTLGFLLYRGEAAASEAFATTDVFRNQLINAAIGRARAAGYYVLFDTFASASHCLALLESGRIDGALVEMMVEDDVLAQLVESTAPVVLVGRDTRLPVSWVKADEEGGAYKLGRHFLAQGHRRLAIVGVDEVHDSVIAQARVSGFRRALAEAGLELGAEQIAHGDWSFESGYSCGQHLLARSLPPTAIFALAEQMAVGVMEAARHLGVQVPDDLAVAATEDNAWVDHVHPTLTAVHVPMFDVGTRATKMLLDRLADPGLRPEQVVVPTTIRVRESSKMPGRRTTALSATLPPLGSPLPMPVNDNAPVAREGGGDRPR